MVIGVHLKLLLPNMCTKLAVGYHLWFGAKVIMQMVSQFWLVLLQPECKHLNTITLPGQSQTAISAEAVIWTWLKLYENRVNSESRVNLANLGRAKLSKHNWDSFILWIPLKAELQAASD